MLWAQTTVSSQKPPPRRQASAGSRPQGASSRGDKGQGQDLLDYPPLSVLQALNTIQLRALLLPPGTELEKVSKTIKWTQYHCSAFLMYWTTEKLNSCPVQLSSQGRPLLSCELLCSSSPRRPTSGTVLCRVCLHFSGEKLCRRRGWILVTLRAAKYLPR